MQHTTSGTQTLTTAISGHHSSLLRFVRLTEVMRMTGLRKTTIYQLQGDGEFPQRVQISAHCVGWIESEVQAWLSERAGSRGQVVGVNHIGAAARHRWSARSQA